MTLSYNPDVWVKLKPSETPGSRYDVYEVWDRQTEEKSIFEVLRVAFTPGIQNYCVVCANTQPGNWTKKGAARYIRAVLENLKSPEISYEKQVAVAEADREILSVERKLLARLSKELYFKKGK